MLNISFYLSYVKYSMSFICTFIFKIKIYVCGTSLRGQKLSTYQACLQYLLQNKRHMEYFTFEKLNEIINIYICSLHMYKLGNQ